MPPRNQSAAGLRRRVWCELPSHFQAAVRQGASNRVDFIVYQEKSASVARDTFHKVAAFVTDKSKTAHHIGDATYWALKSDEESSIHVLKRNTHFAMGVQPNSDTELVSVAATVASKL